MTVYVMECGGYTKIGYVSSDDPAHRVAEIQSMVPFDVRLVGFIPGDYNMERAAQRRFSSRKVRGEWFDVRPETVMRYLRDSPPPSKEQIRERVIAYVAEHPGATTREVARACAASAYHVRSVRPLIQRQDGPDHGWVLAPKAVIA